VASKIQSTWLDKQFAVHFPFLEDQLKTAPRANEGQKGGFCGPQFTAADMLMSFPVMAVTTKGMITKDKFPEIVALSERYAKDPGYQAAVKKVEEIEGKPYVVAP
jgi:glutathione S-transferase